MAVRTAPSHRRRFSLPSDPGRRLAAWSLLMLAASAAALLIGGALGSFLGLVVFDLEEQQLLTDAGVRGYVAAVILVALMTAPPVVGIVLGARARRLGEQRMGGAGVVLNALVAVYLVLTGVATLLLG